MPDAEKSSLPARRPAKQMPRAAIRAIAWSGHFCALTMGFMVYFALRQDFHPVLIGLNAACAVFLFAGSLWMQRQLGA